MIQELLGGGIGVGVSGSGGAEERKIHVGGGTAIEGSSSSSSSSSEQQNLRCPRCDSSNTKFCYYNNYNLTQPRHFCKTCRRYWTKGGALRNVPIGGGCRKNKSSVISTVAGKPITGKARTAISTDVGKTNFGSGLDHEFASSPILWPGPHNSQLMALLRAAQNPNPNHILNSVVIKDEVSMLGSSMVSDCAQESSGFCSRTLSLDPMAQVPMGMCNSIWRSNQPQQQLLQPPNLLQQNVLLGHEPPNGGIQDLYQRLRSANYCTTHLPAFSNSASSATTTGLTEPSPATAGELGYWNSTLQWSDLSTTNGAFP